MMKHTSAATLCMFLIVLMFSLAPINIFDTLNFPVAQAHAATVTASGTFPSNTAVSWSLDSDGLLTISGSGTVSDIRKTSTTDTTSGRVALWVANIASIKKVTMAAAVQPSTLRNWFYKCSALTSLNTTQWDTSKVTNAHYAFYYCSALTSLNVSGFNTSVMTDMGYMFSNCSKLTSLDLSGFNTSKVTTMSSMFSSCSVLKTVKLGSSWSFKGSKTTVLTTLPTPSSTSPYTGKWKASSSGTTYTPSALASAYTSAMADTYYWDGTSALAGTLTLSGSGKVGSAETVSATGVSSGATLAYQWYTAASSAAAGSAISGATSASYTPTVSDLSSYLYVAASDSSGTYAGTILSSRVWIDANVTVTVPTVIATATAADGTITGPSASVCRVTNSSIVPIHVSQIQADPASGFNLITRTNYASATAANSFYMTATPDSGTALDLASYTSGAAPAVGSDWNLTASGGALSLGFSGKIKNIDKSLSSTSVLSINWTFAPGSVS